MRLIAFMFYIDVDCHACCELALFALVVWMYVLMCLLCVVDVAWRGRVLCV